MRETGAERVECVVYLAGCDDEWWEESQDVRACRSGDDALCLEGFEEWSDRAI